MTLKASHEPMSELAAPIAMARRSRETLPGALGGTCMTATRIPSEPPMAMASWSVRRLISR